MQIGRVIEIMFVKHQDKTLWKIIEKFEFSFFDRLEFKFGAHLIIKGIRIPHHKHSISKEWVRVKTDSQNFISIEGQNFIDYVRKLFHSSLSHHSP